MTQKPDMTKTNHLLPFGELSPAQFERLCLWLVTEEGYLHAEHLGEAGSDQGRDVIAYQVTDSDEQLWYFQCKRYQTIGAAILIKEIEKYNKLVKADPLKKPFGVVFVTNATLSADAREEIRKTCLKFDYKCKFWARTELDMLVKKHKGIIEEFFNLKSGAPQKASRIKTDERNVLNLIKEIWNDPVGSRVITTAIILLIATGVFLAGLNILLTISIVLLLLWICGLFKNILIDESLKDKFYPSLSPSKNKKRRVFTTFFIIQIAITILTWQAFPPIRPVNKFTVLVAKFVTDDSDKAGITADILEHLRDATKKYSEIEIIPLGYPITEEQGSQYAHKVAKENNASIVLWGRYPKKTEEVRFTVHFELLTRSKYLFSESEKYNWNASLAEFEKSFQIQLQLSEAISRITLLTLGLIRYEAKDYENAIERFSDALKESFPSQGMAYDKEVYFFRGTSYLSINDLDNAITDFSKAISIKLDYTDAYINRGLAYTNRGEIDKAIVDFNEAIRLNPNYAAAFNNRGLTYGEKGEPDKAISDFNEAIRLNPNYAAAFNNRGLAYAKKGELDTAIVDLNEAIRLNHDFELSFNNRGYVYANKGELDTAIADFTKAIRLNPSYATAYINRASAYVGKSEFEKAIADCSEAIRLSPDLAEAYINRGVAYGKKGDVNKAIMDLNKAIHLKPNQAESFSNRGAMNVEKGELDKAIADCNEAICLNPSYAQAYFNQGNAYARKKELDKAIADFNEAIRLNPKYADAYLNRGGVYVSKGELDKAITDFNDVISQKPDYAYAYFNRGIAYAQKGNKADAKESFNQSRILTNDSNLSASIEQELRKLDK